MGVERMGGSNPDFGMAEPESWIVHDHDVIWGLCNEVGGQRPAAFQFAKRVLAEVKKLDPHRLCSYASNSLEQSPERDVAGLMDSSR